MLDNFSCYRAYFVEGSCVPLRPPFCFWVKWTKEPSQYPSIGIRGVYRKHQEQRQRLRIKTVGSALSNQQSPSLLRQEKQVSWLVPS